MIEQAFKETFPNCPRWVIDDFLDRYSQDVDDLRRQVALPLTKPYGENLVLRRDGDWGLSLVRLRPDRSTSLHVHNRRRELFVVRQGTLTLISGDRRQSVLIGEWATSTPTVPHQLRNDGDDLLEILEIFSPALMDDKVRIKDCYGRRVGQVGHLE